MNPSFLITALAQAATHKASEEYEKSQRENAGSLNPPIFLLILGLIDMSIFLVVGIIMAFSFTSEELWAEVFCYIVDIIMFSLGLYLFLYYLNFRVNYKNGIITYSNIFHITKNFDCRDIKSVYCKDRGGVIFYFKNGKKLKFDKEENYFSQLIIQNENLERHFLGEENPVVKVCFHHYFMIPLWIFSLFIFIISLIFEPKMIFFPIVLLVFCIGNQISYTSFDFNTKILTRCRFGFKSQYDMHHYFAKPVMENGFIMKIEIYDQDGVAAELPMSTEYKNRARMIYALCKIYI